MNLTNHEESIMKPEVFFEGYRTKKAEIAERGFIAARDSFNAQYPVGAKPASPDEYYRAEGELQALVEALR